MPNDNSNGCILSVLYENINSVICCYVDGCCFTGLLTAVSECSITLITRSCTQGCNQCSNRYGRVTMIPTCKIDAVTFCRTSC